MNAPLPSPTPSTFRTPNSELPTQNAPNSALPTSEHRRTGKIARLPKATRDQINQRLLDGLPYRAIIDQLGLGVWNITEHNLCSWKEGGYQDWLRAREWHGQLRSQLNLAAQLLPQQDFAPIHHACLQLALTQLTRNLRTAGPDLAAQVPQTYLRLLLTLCRLSQETLRCEKHRQTCPRTQQAPQPGPGPAPQSDSSCPDRRTVVAKLRRLLGLK